MSTALAEVNMGTVDRAARVVLGLGIIGLFLASPVPAYVGLAGLVLALTGVIAYCPAYALFGLRTCRTP